MTPNKPINEVLADNLRYFMALRKLTSQSALAERSGVAQRTISNYLRPALRLEGSSGKAPSAKVSELEMVAKALDVEVWQLLRQLTPAERIIYAKVEEAFAEVRRFADAQPETSFMIHEPTKRYGAAG